jgi:hypothetical protein
MMCDKLTFLKEIRNTDQIVRFEVLAPKQIEVAQVLGRGEKVAPASGHGIRPTDAGAFEGEVLLESML